MINLQAVTDIQLLSFPTTIKLKKLKDVWEKAGWVGLGIKDPWKKLGRVNIKDCREKFGVMGIKAGFGCCQSCLGKAGWVGVGIKDL